jgi:hypothetical protein
LLGGAAGFLVRNASPATVADLDMFHEMALIREALSIGRIPYEDSFAFVPTVTPVVHHEWGTGLVLYLFAVTSGWGLSGIVLLRWLLVAAIGIGAWMVARRRGGDEVVLALLASVGATLVGAGFSPVRAQMFTYLFVIAMLLLVPAHARLGMRFVLAWLAIFVVWLNMHGGFVVGMGLFAIFTAESAARTFVETGRASMVWHEDRHLFLALFAMLLLVLVNPYGWHYPGYVLEALRLDRPLIAEWGPIWDPRVAPFLQLGFTVSLAVVLYAVFHRRHLALLPGLPMLAAAGFFAVRHQRIVPIYAILWFCLLPGYLAGTPLEVLLRRWAKRYAPAVAITGLIIALFGAMSFVRSQAWRLELPETPQAKGIHYPVGAVRFLEQAGFSGNLMTHFTAGAYVSWMLHPRVRVGLDSRYEVAYPPEWIMENAALYAAQGHWQSVLERYAPDAVLVPVHAPLDAALRGSGEQTGWNEWYRDGGYAVYGTTTAP